MGRQTDKVLLVTPPKQTRSGRSAKDFDDLLVDVRMGIGNVSAGLDQRNEVRIGTSVAQTCDDDVSVGGASLAMKFGSFRLLVVVPAASGEVVVGFFVDVAHGFFLGRRFFSRTPEVYPVDG